MIERAANWFWTGVLNRRLRRETTCAICGDPLRGSGRFCSEECGDQFERNQAW